MLVRAKMLSLTLMLVMLAGVAVSWGMQQITETDIKAIDGKVLITVNVNTEYKVFLKDKLLKVIFANTFVALDRTDATVESGPVKSLKFQQEGTNAVLLIYLNYDKPEYNLEREGGYTYLMIKFPSLPQPEGPSVAKKEEHIKKHITLTGTPKKVKVEKPAVSTPVKLAESKPPVVKVKKVTSGVPAKYKKTSVSTKPKTQVKVVSPNTVSLELAGANLVDVVRLIGYKLGWNLVIDPKVEGTVTIKLKNVDAERALRIILATQGYSYKKVGNIVYVGPSDKVESLKVEEVEELGPTKVQVIPLENAEAKDIEPIIKSTYPKAEVQVDEATNSIILKAPVKLIPEIRDLIGQLDVPPPPPPPVTPPVTEMIYVNYAKAEDVQKMLGGLVPEDAVQVDERLNALVVTAAPDVIDIVRNFVKTVDVPDPQVELRMILLDLTESAAKKLGIQWSRQAKFDMTETQTVIGEGGESEDSTGPFADWGLHWFTRTGFTLTENMISVVADKDNATVLATPYVCTMNKQAAEIHIGDRIPIVYYDARAGMYQAQYTEVGVVLRVTPEISFNDYVLLKFEAEVSEPTQFIQQYPQIQERKTSITVRVKDGETVIIGGLLNEKVARNLKKVPLLGDIPILGELFKHRERTKQRTDLVVAITPKIFKPDLRKAEESEKFKRLEKRHRENWESRY